MKIMTTRLTVLLLSLALLMAGCGGMRPGYETPTVTVNSVRSLPSGGAMPAFEIGLHVVNPNREPLKLVGAAYTISLDGRDLVKGVANDLPVIDGYGEGDITLTASADLIAGARFISDLLRSGKDSVRYELEAKLDVGGLGPAIRVRDAGEIALGSGR